MAPDAGGNGAGKFTTRPERQQGGGVTRGRPSIREENRLAFSAAAAEKILNDEDFHCPAEGRGEGCLRKL